MVKKIKVVDIVNEEPINEQEHEEPTLETNEPDVEQVTVEPVVEQAEQTPKPKAKTRSKKKQSVETHEVPTLEVEPAQEVEATPEIQEEPSAAVEVNKDKVKKVIEQVILILFVFGSYVHVNKFAAINEVMSFILVCISIAKSVPT